jgi:HrpA-like RNA helicase
MLIPNPSNDISADSEVSHSSPSKDPNALKLKREAYSTMVQRLHKWSIENYHRQPSKNIQHLSLTPSIFRVSVIIDEEKGVLGVGMGTSLKLAERQAMETLDKVVRLFDESREKNDNCPVKDLSAYMSFEDDNDKAQPWFSFVKNYVDSLSILHTRQASQVEECIEWDNRFWITLKVEGQPTLLGKGVHTTKKKATNLAAIVIAHQLDARAASNSGKAPIEPAVLPEFSEYLAKDPEECSSLPWVTQAKSHIHRIFSKQFKKEPIFEVQTVETVKPIRYIARVVFDENIDGKGQSLNSKEAIRLACIDLCSKLWKLSPGLFECVTTPAATTTVLAKNTDVPKLSTTAEQNKSPNENVQASLSATKKTEDPASATTATSIEKYSDWEKKPKFVIHDIFIKQSGRPPVYKLDEDASIGITYSSITLKADNSVIVGRGKASNASQASFNAALDFCRKYFSKISLGDKRLSDEDEKAPQAKSLKSNKERPLFETLGPISINAEFLIWVFRHLNQQPIIRISNRGPAHSLVWQSVVNIRIHSQQLSGKSEASAKKIAIVSSVNELTRLLREFDPTLYERFELEKEPKNQPLTKTVDQQPKLLSSNVESTNNIAVKEPASLKPVKPQEIRLVVSSDDKSSLQSLCDPRRLKTLHDIVEEQNRIIAKSPSSFDVKSQSFPSHESLSQKNLLLGERQAQLYSSKHGIELLHKRQASPSFRARDKILNALIKSSVVITEGAVGCGMSSQISLVIFENMIANHRGVSCNILVIVSSNIEAIALANHLANERGTKVGEEIGYRVDDDSCEPIHFGSIMFITYPCFIRAARNTRVWGEYSHIFLDDISSRSLEVDLSLMIIREIISKHHEVRLLANLKEDGPHMSSLLASYFSKYPIEIVQIEVLQNNFCQLQYLDDIVKVLDLNEVTANSAKESDTKLALEGVKPNGVPFSLIDLTIRMLLNTQSNAPNSLLVIVPTFFDASKLRQSLVYSNALESSVRQQNISIHLLHANMTYTELTTLISESRKTGSMTLIIATDVIETGFVSCLDLPYVIDCGLRLGPNSGSARVYPVSESQEQDAELSSNLAVVDHLSLKRRSRHSNKFYFVLAQYKAVGECRPPCEAKRVSVDQLLMASLKILGNQLVGCTEINKLVLRLPEPPNEKEIEECTDRLTKMLLLSPQTNLLTEFGEIVSRIPLEPKWARFLIASVLMRCLDAGLVISAAAAVGVTPLKLGRTEDPLDLKKYASDHFAIFVAYNRWQEARHRFLTHTVEQNYCHQNCLDLPCLQQIEKVRNRLFECLDKEVLLLSNMVSLYSPEQGAIKQIFNANLEKRSIIRGLLVYALSDQITIGHGPTPLHFLQTKHSVIPISETSACSLAEFSTEMGPGMFVFESVNAEGKATGVSRVPAMAGALLSHHSLICQTPFDFSTISASPLQAANWLDLNYRESKLLVLYRQALHMSIVWLTSNCGKSQAIQEVGKYAQSVVSLAASLIRYHSSFEQ